MFYQYIFNTIFIKKTYSFLNKNLVAFAYNLKTKGFQILELIKPEVLLIVQFLYKNLVAMIEFF